MVETGALTKFNKVHVSGCDQLIIPINFRNNHWSFIEVDNKNRTITYNDSLSPSKSKAEQPFQVVNNFLMKAIQHEQSQSNSLLNGLANGNGHSNYDTIMTY